MNYFLAFLIGLLTGCAQMHEPELATQPKHKEAYQADLDRCRNESATTGPEYAGAILTGGLGMGLVMSLEGKEADMMKTGSERVDECLTKLGYHIKG